MSGQAGDQFIHWRLLFEIVGDHPHSGEHGHPVGDGPETVSQLRDMTLMHLVDCQHGGDGCYAARENLRLLSKHHNAPEPQKALSR